MHPLHNYFMKTDLMYSPPLFLFFFFLLLPLSSRAAASDLDVERAALTILVRAFNHPILNTQWVGEPCFHNHSSWYGIQCLDDRVISISLESIGLSGSIGDPLALASLTKLKHLSFKNNSISGNMIDFSTNLNLSTIDLSANMFSGPLSGSLPYLYLLESLQLHNNMFEGAIPPLNQTSLRSFNVSYNNLTGEIPERLQFFASSAFIGNPGLCGKPTLAICPGPVEPKKHNIFTKSPFVSVFVILDICVLILLLWSLFVFWKKIISKVKEANKEEGKKEGECWEKSEVVKEGPRRIEFVNGVDHGFELEDLLKASAEGLGKGSFGSCYKAKLDEERGAVVVKRLRDLSPLTCEEFGNHMRVLAGLNHPNVLPLIGFYCSSDDKLFFYKFVSQGNLYDRIHGGRGREDRTPFEWANRLAVAKGVAKAMKYLHLSTKGSLAVVPHGNLKSSNVLLANDDTPLVCDYGLIPLVPAPLATQRMMAYRSPEYQDNRIVSLKSDVWSYGCLLLELVTGKVSNHTTKGGVHGVDLCHWVHRAVREEWTGEVFDAEISGQRCVMKDMFKLLQLALRCCERFPERRPEMAEVAREVEGIKVIETTSDDEEYSA